MNENDYIEINRKLWNDKTGVHVKSEFYDVDSFIAGKNSLNSVELSLLGELKDKSVLHLQCHFGMDTISMSRLGAKVTGIDLSDKSIEKAKELAARLNTDTQFVQSDVYELKNKIDKKFDIVFTSYGAIGWLPDMQKWADVVSHFMKPGGKFVMVEFHPVIWMFAYDFSKIEFGYFNTGAVVEEITGTYTDRNAPIKSNSVSWNHNLGEVISALIRSGLTLESFDEFDYSPYDCFENTVKADKGKYQIRGLEGKIPMIYSLTAKK